MSDYFFKIYSPFNLFIFFNLSNLFYEKSQLTY